MHLPRPAVLAIVAGLSLAGCGDADEPRDERGRVSVGAVALATPEGWERIDEPADPPLLERTRFVDPGRRLRLVQVVVGCDEGGLDALVGSVGQPRGPLVVTGAEEHVPPPQVEGLERARRVTLELGSGADGEPASFVTEALYGQHGDALVLVEVNVPVAGGDGDVDADAVLDSLVADGAALDASCGA